MDILPPGLDRLSDTANVLNAGGPLRQPFIQDLFDTRPMDVFEAFVDMDPTLLPPVAALRSALLYSQLEAGRILPDGNPDQQARIIAQLLKLVVSRYRELATNEHRRKSMWKFATVAQKERISNVVRRVVVEQKSWTTISRSLSRSSQASSSHCSGVDARRFDDDAGLEAELASLEEDDACKTSLELFNEDELDAEITELEAESGIHPSSRSC